MTEVPIPSPNVALITYEREAPVPEPSWYRYFNSFNGPPGLARPLTVTGPPFAYTVPVLGSVFISGGTVTSVTITRGRVTVPTGVTQGVVPAGKLDVVTIAFSALPTVWFLPS